MESGCNLSGPKLSSIHRLPDELLVEILDHIRDENLQHMLRYRDKDRIRLPFALVASAVNSRWRLTAIHTPSLWTDIYLSPSQSTELVNVQVERSKNLPLNIIANLFQDYHNVSSDYVFQCLKTVKALMDVVSPRIHRWRLFQLTVSGGMYDRKYMNALLDPLLHTSALLLRHLDLAAGIPFNLYLPPLLMANSTTPNLCHLGFTNADIRPHLRIATGLTSLTISNIPYLMHVQFRDLLRSCPDLTDLSLDATCVLYPGAPHLDDLPIHVPSLHSLSLDFFVWDLTGEEEGIEWSDETDFISNFFRLFTAPSLQYLTMSDASWSTLRAFISAMKSEGCRSGSGAATSKFPALSRLCLWDAVVGKLDSTTGRMREMALCFPSIECLEFYNRGFGDPGASLLSLTAIPDGRNEDYQCESLWPHLRTLIWPVLTASDESPLCEFIKHRIEIGKPIARLRTRGRCFNANVRISNQQWLREHVEVQLYY